MIQNRGDEAAEWDVWAKQFPIGTNVEGEVLDVWQVGAHIQLDFGPQALLLNSEMRWEGFVPDARVILHKGQRVTVQILSVEPWRQRISVSLRRALNDPWKEYAGSYKKGRTARARVTQFARDEVLIEFEDHVSGFIPRAEIAEGAARAEEILEIGDWVEVNVLEKEERHREVKASMRLRLIEIEEEIRGEPTVTAAMETENPAPEPPGTSVEAHPTAEAPTPRILVVEDDPLQRLQLRAILEDLGYRQVGEAGSGPEAIEAMKECDYDIVLMDQEMPQGEGDAGIRAAEKIKEACPRTSIKPPPWNGPPCFVPAAPGMPTGPSTARMCRTASTISPVPASPLVRIMAAPSPIRRRASA